MENKELTKEEKSKIYNKLEENNNDAEKLAKAKEAAENIEETELAEMEIPEEVEIAESSHDTLKKTLEEQGDLSDEQAETLIEIIMEYRKTKTLPTNVMELLPVGMKSTVLSMTGTKLNSGRKITRTEALCFVLDSFINDADMNQLIVDYEEEMNRAYIESNEELNGFINDKYEELFGSVDEIRKENPAKADRIATVKSAYAEAKQFSGVYKYIDELASFKKLKKEAQFRYKNRLSYFNVKVNQSELKIPNIELFVMVIANKFEDIDAETIKLFVLSVIDSTANLPMDLEDNLYNMAYVYKLIDQVVDYGYAAPGSLEEDPDYDTIFGSIDKCLKLIQTKNK